MKKKSFKFKLIFISVILVFIPMSIVCSFLLKQFQIFTEEVISESFDSMEKMGIENIQAFVNSDYQRINALITKIENVAINLATSSILNSFITAEEKVDKKDKDLVNHSVKDILKTSRINKEELQDAKNAIKNEIIEIYGSTNLRINSNDFNLINQVHFIDPNGYEKIAFCKGQFSSIKQSSNENRYFKNCKKYFDSNKFSDIYHIGISIEPNTNVPELLIASPVHLNQEFKGIVVINLNWNTVRLLLEKHVYGKTGYAFIFDSTGILISHPKYSFREKETINTENYGNLWEQIENEIKENNEMAGKYHFENKDHIFFFKTFKLSKKIYAVAAISPIKEFLPLSSIIKETSQKNYGKSIQVIVCIMLISLFVTIFFSFLVSRSMSKAIISVNNYIENVSKGDLTKTLEIKRYDEIGNMVMSLNNMITKQRKLLHLSNLRNLPEPIIEIDKDFNLTYINESAAQSFGIISDKWMGKKCYELITNDHCETDKCGCYRVMLEKKSSKSESRATLNNIEQVPVSYTCVPIFDQENVVGAIAFIAEQKDIYRIINEVKKYTTELNQSSEDLTNISESMKDSTRQIFDLSDKTNKNIRTIAVQEISANVNNEAKAIEQMTTSLTNVAKFTSNAKYISQNAHAKSSEVNERIKTLVMISEQIELIIAVIDEIADRTDLLALNAAIEAEGAGAAGKGFAVVAKEVQKLARQSSEATTEITKEISVMQKSVQETLMVIESINSLINDINTINHDISAAVEQQKMTAIEISETVNHTAKKVMHVAKNSQDTSELMDQMNYFANNNEEIAEKTKSASDQLSNIASSLFDIVCKF